SRAHAAANRVRIGLYLDRFRALNASGDLLGLDDELYDLDRTVEEVLSSASQAELDRALIAESLSVDHLDDVLERLDAENSSSSSHLAMRARNDRLRSTRIAFFVDFVSIVLASVATLLAIALQRRLVSSLQDEARAAS